VREQPGHIDQREPARQLLARHAVRLGGALARFDELVRDAAPAGRP
jgi:hypothetical protein